MKPGRVGKRAVRFLVFINIFAARLPYQHNKNLVLLEKRKFYEVDNSVE